MPYIAYAYESNRAYEQAIEEFDSWTNDYSKDDRMPRVRHERCWCCAASGFDLENALADCDAAIKHHNDDSQARVNRGLVWLRLGMPDIAIADFKQANKKTATAMDANVQDQFREIGLGMM